MFGKPNKKTQKSPWGDDHPERFNDSPSPTVGFKQQLKGLVNPDQMLSQLFGEKKQPENAPAGQKETPKKKSNEILLFSRVHEKESTEVRKETQMIMQKLTEQINILERSENNLVKEVAKIKVEQLPPKTGIYYIRFLEWLLTVVKQLRIKVEQGRAWLETFNQRKKKKMGYWAKYKKHGTTFGLSHERTVATQTG